jgi:hypothetical protein
LTYGFGVGLTSTDGVAEADRKIAIHGGDITFAFSSTSRDVAPDTDSVEFGVLTISNFGEAIEIKDGLTLILDVDTSDITDDGDADGAGLDTNFNTITDVRLVNVDTGATFMGPADPDSWRY